jgi:FAD binding domain/D-arabinono-1,4-lactone oxidase
MDLEKLLEHLQSLSPDELLKALEGTLRAPEISAPPLGPPLNIPGIAWKDGAFHAMSVADVTALVIVARTNNRKLRVAGSQHSAEQAIFSPKLTDLRVVLDGDLRNVDLLAQDANSATVRVGGGCYLGKNPKDPASTWSNSLNAQLEALGVSLPILGGITHQSVSGFMQTCSSGGSLNYGFADAVVAIEWVDGTGQRQMFHQGSREFFAAGVAMGLFGVVTHVTLRCKPRYFVAGTETNHLLVDSYLARRSDGTYPLQAALSANDYMHLNWFPQAKVQRVIQWVGQRVDQMDPFKPYDSELRSKLMTVLAAVVLRIGDLLDHTPNLPGIEDIIGALLKPFVPVPQTKDFHDFWYHALPSDDEVDTVHLIPLKFTEFWIPVNQTGLVLDRLNAALEDQQMAGNFAVEFYGAKDSPFWLSPSNGGDVVCVDVFWWGHNFGRPEDFFAHYWNTLLDVPGTRFHWGKYLPTVGRTYANIPFGPNFIRKAYGSRAAGANSTA